MTAVQDRGKARGWLPILADEAGWVTVSGIFWTMSLVTVGAVAVDFSYRELSETHLGATADAAALAGAQDLPDPDKARRTALDYIQKNSPVSVYGTVSQPFDVEIGTWDSAERAFTATDTDPDTVRVTARRTGEAGYGDRVPMLLAGIRGHEGWQVSQRATAVRRPPICTPQNTFPLGDLASYLFYVDDGRVDANWQGATKGFVGDVAVNGVVASERTSGGVPYDGTLVTNAGSLGAWQGIVDQNPGASAAIYGETDRIAGLQSNLHAAIAQFSALPPTPGYESVSATALDGMNTRNGQAETMVINVTSDMSVSRPLTIYGDDDDLFVIRWDTSPGTSGFQGQVKFSGGGGINPLGGLTPGNFINLAGDINASGGGGGLHDPSNIPGGLGCAVFAFEQGSAVINSSTRIAGDVCYGKGVTSLTNQKAENFTGTVRVHGNASFAHTSKNFLPSGGISVGTQNSALEAEHDRLLNLSGTLAQLEPTDMLPMTLTTSATLRADPSGLTVVELETVNLNGATLTLDGPGTYVFNFTGRGGTFDWSHAQVVLRNGADAGSIFWNFPEAYNIMINKDTNVFRGHILAPKSSVIYHNPADFDGSISALHIDLHSMFHLEGLPVQFDDPGAPQSGLAEHLARIQNPVSGGGFFTGYWLTTGDPRTYESSSLSNAIFVGGWYTKARKFSMTSGTSGVHVPPPANAGAPGTSTCEIGSYAVSVVLVE